MTGKHTEALGRWLGTHLETPERAISEKDMREEVIAGARRIQRRRRLQKAAGAISLTIAVLFGVTAVYRQGRVDQAIRFSLEPDAQPGQVGAYVAPSGAAPLGLRFSDGSHVELEPGARARVSETTARGATFLLETGRAEVDVIHRPHANWMVIAGPYSVHVHGTSFAVEFNAESQQFELLMRSGVVTVEGPGLSSPVEIRGAQRFVHRAGAGTSTIEQTSPASAEERAAAVPSAVPAADVDRTSEIEPMAAGDRDVHQPTPAESWSTMVGRGRYSAVVRQATVKGIGWVVTRASAQDLMALANAARFSGRTDLGSKALLAIRRRFSGSTYAVSAAYLMGRLTETSNPGEALRWYERYQVEAPSGPLVAEAMGRRMLLVRDSGNGAEAARLAAEYDRRFPSGPYAGVARKIASP